MSYYSDLILAESGLQSYWKLDEASAGVSDSKGSLSGTAGGSAFTYQQAGAYPALGKALVSNASAYSKMTFGDNLNFTGTNAWTLEAWINRGTDTGGRFISKYNESTGHGYYLALSGSQLYGGRHNGTTGTFITGGRTLSANTWYHVALTYDGSNLNVYVNGVSDATQVASSQSESAASSNPFTLYTSADTGFTSAAYAVYGFAMQHVAVYNVAKSESTLLAHYQAGPKAVTSDSWAWTDTNVTNRTNRTTSDAWAWTDTTSRGTIPARTPGTARVIFQGGTGGAFGDHYAFSNIVRMADGRLRAFARKASTHGSYDGDIVTKTSSDDGVTWSSETTLLNHSVTGYDERDTFCVRLTGYGSNPAGRLVFTWGRRKQVGGADNGGPSFMYSDDNGATWSTPVSVAHSLFAGTSGVTGLVYGSDIVELHNGDLLLFGYGTHSSGSSHFDLFCSKSTDGGATWAAFGTLPAWTDYSFNTVEPQVELFSTGKLIMTFHTEDGLPTDFYTTTSTNSGSTWATPTKQRTDTQNRQGLTVLDDGKSAIISFLSNTGGTGYQYMESGDYGATWNGPNNLYVPSTYHGLWAMSASLHGVGEQQNIGFAVETEQATQQGSTVYFVQLSGTDGIFVHLRTTSDAWAWTDTNTRSIQRNRTTSDAWAWSDAATRTAPKSRTTSDAWAWTDTNTRSPSKSRTTTDTWTWTDTSTPGRSQGRITFLDTWAWADSATRTVSLVGVTYTRTTTDLWAWRDASRSPLTGPYIMSPTYLASTHFGSSTLQSALFGGSTVVPVDQLPVS